MKIKSLFLALSLVTIGVLSARAQGKIGFVDATYIISQLPAYKQIKTEMDQYRDKIKAELDVKQKEYQTKVEEFQELVKKPPLPPEIVLQEKAKRIQELEQEILELERTATAEYQDTLNKKLAPVYEKMNQAINDVAAAEGSIFILRKEALLFQKDANNLSDKVIQKLGATSEKPVAGSGNLSASNKLGVFDLNFVLGQLPEYKRAENDLQVYQKKLAEGLQTKQQEVQRIYQQLENLPETAPQEQRQALVAQLEAVQKDLQEAQKNAEQQFSKKQAEILEPIYKNIQDQIDVVAKDGSYTYVLRIEASLYEPDAHNISAKVLEKMGVTAILDNNEGEAGDND